MSCVNKRSSFTFAVLLMFIGALIVGAASAKVLASSTKAGEKAGAVPKDGEHKKMEKAMFGAGCFWGVEETFRHIPGVISTAVGYSGGTTKNPTYKDVCSGTTGHVEVVEVDYDPSKISYEKLLDVFFANHDPTTLNRQGPDHGYQYRSVVFYTTAEQERLAKIEKDKLDRSGKFASPIVTAIEPAKEFYKAEEYHQNYLEKNGLKVCH